MLAKNYFVVPNKTMTKDLTIRQKKFLEDAREVHGDKYIYDITKYINIGTKIPIKCPKHGFFDQTPRDHIHSKAGCPDCGVVARMAGYNQKLKDSKFTFGDRYPELLKQWDYERNNIDPFSIGTAKRIKIHWICIRGHRTYSDLRNKIAGSGCKYCSSSVSKLELTVYSLIKAMFDDALWSVRLYKKEADIYIPTFNIVVEVDGYPWHNTKSSERRDLQKTKVFNEKGLRLIRFRDKKNLKIEGEVFLFEYKNLQNDLDRFYEYLFQTFELCLKKQEVFIRKDNIYQSLIERHPKPKFEKTLEGVFSDIVKFWSDENILSPDAITAGSQQQHVFLLCSSCRKIFGRRASSVTWPILCERCGPIAGAKKRIQAKLDVGEGLGDLYPDLAKEWSSKNTKRPSEYLATSPTVVFWVCKKHGDYPSAIRDRVRYKTGCRTCGSERGAQKRLKTYILTALRSEEPVQEKKGIKAVAEFIGCSEPMVSKMLKTQKSYKGFKIKVK